MGGWEMYGINRKEYSFKYLYCEVPFLLVIKIFFGRFTWTKKVISF